MSFGADGQWVAIGWLQPAKGCRAGSVRLDLRYAENWSFALDLPIMWKTISDSCVVLVRTRGCLADEHAGDTRGMTAHMNVNPKAGNRALPGVSSRSREGSGPRVPTSEIGESK
jgi:hypothetical protein